MIWCRFEARGYAGFGIVEDEFVNTIEGNPFAEYRTTQTRYPIADVKLLPPVMPGTFYCAGVNYRAHVEKMAARRGTEPKFPARPDIGYRANNALIGHEDDIVKPRDSGPDFQYEGELVAVFGKRVKHVSREEAMDCIFGWTIGNDVSERGWQASDRTLWRAKNSDTFKPMGPWIVTGLDPVDMKTTIRLNGKVMDSFDTGKMIFNAADFICEMTKYITVHPGDVMWLGTDGVPENMKPGDVVEIDISGIGTLRNRVVAE
jgi:2-keto-4-pentenoate hydratase/2-oxohepta-3-ene-1,7-dioic acid hydratase in catechol pathway